MGSESGVQAQLSWVLCLRSPGGNQASTWAAFSERLDWGRLGLQVHLLPELVSLSSMPEVPPIFACYPLEATLGSWGLPTVSCFSSTAALSQQDLSESLSNTFARFYWLETDVPPTLQGSTQEAKRPRSAPRWENQSNPSPAAFQLWAPGRGAERPLLSVYLCWPGLAVPRTRFRVFPTARKRGPVKRNSERFIFVPQEVWRQGGFRVSSFYPSVS